MSGKIDRLTRSLAHFAKLVERLEKAGCSFISVTQAFNTSSKRQTFTSGRTQGGGPFSRAQLHYLLTNTTIAG